MNTKPRIIESRIAAAAPGFLARPSHAADATRDWAIPQNAAAIAIENPEAIAIHVATRSGGFSLADAWANTGVAIRPNTAANNSSVASFFTSFLLSSMNSRQEVAPGHPSCRPGSHWTADQSINVLRRRPCP